MSVIGSYFQKLFRLKLPNQKIRLQAYEQITRTLNKAFQLPSLKQYASTLSIKGLLNKSVQMFVGSRNVPKNVNLSRYLINVAESRSNNPREKDEIQYYKYNPTIPRYFFIRIDAFKSGKTQEFDMTSQVINQLADEKKHPQSCYLAGKQIFNIAINTRQIAQRRQMLKLASIYFQNSLTDSNLGGLYYLGEIYSTFEYSNIEENQYIQFFNFGAALGDPLCYFKLSLIYLGKKDIKLHLFYLKLAAESGVVQAQHNLGCEYLQGKNLDKDEVKALAWFMHAAANGYIQSKFNVAQIFLHGSKCGRIKKNPKVALVKLQQLKSTGQAVDEKIQQIINSNPDIKRIVQQQEKGQEQNK